MKTFQIMITCHNAEALEELLEDLVSDVRAEAERVNEIDVEDELFGDDYMTVKRVG